MAIVNLKDSETGSALRHQVGSRIREFRKDQGLTLEQVGLEAGTSGQTIQRLEAGTMTLSVDWLQRISETLGIPARDFFPGQEACAAESADERFIANLRRELARARRKFPSSELSTIALMEEVGELAQALLEWRLGNQRWEAVVMEAEQVATTAMRVAIEGDPSIRAMESA
jgi:transcriptional regulator with XRE-family HTH domain